MTKIMQVTSQGRGTWAGREVETDLGLPVVGVPEDVGIGDRIVAEYRSTKRYGLWFFKELAPSREKP